jgi:hypothetical protein
MHDREPGRGQTPYQGKRRVPVGPLEHLLGSITTLAGMATRGRCTCKGLPAGRAPGAARDHSQRAEHAAAASPHDAAGLLLRSFHVGA